eukprot:CAMPEP_0175902664 /NCGR_PEP_ID=MMETSP0108-20121206/3511_1 /TAXON_ID=195067 ORGANISM="Goniomonas pacifica, Strain CCMP1869" /NCGR_SAMPLE_ID=MMETSP0108 /ASSEMBLY_ACC=CAM_ASM_000204 /LENGTH=168 /DNA_ID=CAMNT_0017224319 /DNA_START=142 /DNA_END=648 /DNA_ORIENTATION=+
MKHPVLSVGDAAQISAAYNEYLDKYVLFYANQWRSIGMVTSSRLEGPWGETETIYKLEGSVGEHFAGLIYCPYIHPELALDKGRVSFLSYSLVPPQGMSDAPHLIEIVVDHTGGSNGKGHRSLTILFSVLCVIAVVGVIASVVALVRRRNHQHLEEVLLTSAIYTGGT